MGVFKKRQRVLYKMAGAEREEVARLVRQRATTDAQLEALVRLAARREGITDVAFDTDRLEFLEPPKDGPTP